MTSAIQIVITILYLIIPFVTCQFTNLPDVPPGVFNASTRIEIQSTFEAAWDALTRFPAYENWNPFVRLGLHVGVSLSRSNVHPESLLS